MWMNIPRVTTLWLFLSHICMAAVWTEVGDAGRLPSTAQATVGFGTLDTIFGNLENADPAQSLFDVDLYLIRIFDPLNFFARTVNAPGLYVSDPQLFLFNSSGLGIYMNDDDESGLNASQSRLPGGHPFGPLVAGLYLLGTGWWNNEPLSITGQIFSDANDPGTNGPGAGGSDPLMGWDDNVLARIDLETDYEINLTGAEFAVIIPEPNFFPAVGAALVWLFLRQRRRNKVARL